MIAQAIKTIDAVNYRLGRVAMYGIFALGAVLLWSSVSKVFFLPSLWTLEMAQYLMVAYYILGGPYSLQLGSHVRMDLVYGTWGRRRKLQVDCVTILGLLFYLGVMLYGGLESTGYAVFYGERSPSAWRPYLWPIKVIMCFGLVMMILQCVSELLKDILSLRSGDENKGREEKP